MHANPNAHSQTRAHLPAGLTLAYLVNQYPKLSHTFIRREIQALEALGARVERFSLRAAPEALVEPADQLEQARTTVLLQAGPAGLAAALAWALRTRPRLWGTAVRLALRLGARSDRGRGYHLIYLAEACLLLRHLAQRPVRHLHAHFGTNSAAVALLCRALGGPPYSLTLHGPDDFERALHLALEEKVAGAAFVVTVSSYGRGQLYRWLRPELWSRVHVVHTVVDDTFLDAPRTPIPEAPRFVSVGRLAPEKGHLLLLQALHRLAAEGQRCEWVLVGDGPSRGEIISEIGRLDLAGCVTLTGAVGGAEVQRHILEARALVLPSLAENLPVVLLEALALGRPVIATAIAGIPELVEPGVCGWLVPSGSVEALAGALREALQTPGERLARMGCEGRRRVAERHAAAGVARKLLNLFAQDGETGL